jgi:hypothetical protein
MKSGKKNFIRDVKLFVRDKNYSNNFKNNFEIEVPFEFFDFILQNISELIIFYWKNRKLRIQNLFFTLIFLILRIIFVTNKQFYIPYFLITAKKEHFKGKF